jgi:hypothetical protein
MSSDLVYGTLLSVPIGIGTALITPWLQKKWDDRSKSRTLDRSKRSWAELERIKTLRENPAELTQYLVYITVRTALISAMMVVAAAVPNLMAQAFHFYLLYIPGQFITLIGSILVINVCRPALVTWDRVKNFADYEKRVLSEGPVSRDEASRTK